MASEDFPHRLSPADIRRAIFASTIGNGLEWFDFLIYGFFAAIISGVFFPAESTVLSLLLTYATFGIGFLVRPLGGILLGIYADRFGRRRALSLLILLMAGGTLVLGITPGYATIGVAAPIIVVIARLLQGLSVGGEFASATAMLIEYAPINKKMYYGAFQMCSQSLALMLAAGFVYALSTFLDHNALVNWGWRLPFLAGALIGPIGFYIRRRVAESPEFVWLEEHRPRQRSPLAALARGHLSAIVFAIGLVIAGTAGVYLWDTYLPVYVLRTLQLPLSVSMRNVALIGLIGTVVNPLIGALADRVGAYRVFLPSVVVMGLLSYPLFAFIIGAPSAGHLLEVQLIAGLLRMGISAPIPGLMAVTFPTEARSTGMAIAYNISVAVFGGLAPFTVTGLMAATGSRFVPAYYLASASLLTIALVLAFRPARMPGLVAAETLSVPTR
jgi:MHS family proline/betaine transporter-like MFS transporter